MEFVRMNASHILQIACLEQQCFSMPWSENALRSELTNPLSLWIVATEGDVVAGYVGSQAVLGEADMMNLAVSSDFRRRGVAETLVLELVQNPDRVFEMKVNCLKKAEQYLPETVIDILLSRLF